MSSTIFRAVPADSAGRTIFAHQKLGAKLREPAILMLAKIEGAANGFSTCRSRSRSGVTQAQADAIAQQSVVRGEDAGTFLRNQTGEFGHPE